MRKITSAITVGLLTLTMFAPYALASSFSDINGHWAEETINKYKDSGIITGYPDGTFKPDIYIIRSELAKVLALAFDLEKKELNQYEDLDTSTWYYPYLEYSARYITGYPLVSGFETNKPYVDNWDDKKFLPDRDAIRMHVAEALVKIKIEQQNLTVELPDFNEIYIDLNKYNDPDYFNTYRGVGRGIPKNVTRMFEYTWLAKELNVMQGDENGHFRPYDRITRAELLTAIDRILAG